MAIPASEIFETAETRWEMRFREGERPPAALWAAMLHSTPYIPPRGDAPEPVVAARVNAGRWQVCCPYCPSAQHASATDRRFYCAACLNREGGHLTLPVVWPPNPGEIEEALARRPNPLFRHWEPGETLAALAAQDKMAIAAGVR
jgi:hypothetical protein